MHAASKLPDLGAADCPDFEESNAALSSVEVFMGAW